MFIWFFSNEAIRGENFWAETKLVLWEADSVRYCMKEKRTKTFNLVFELSMGPLAPIE